MSLPTVLSYIATFLPEEAWHIHRQVTGVRAYRNLVATRRRENADRFPHQPLHVLPRPWHRGLWRAAHRLLGARTVPLTRTEVDALLGLRRREDAVLVHIYLGNEALRALPYLRRETCPRIVSFHGADLASGFSPRDFATLDPHVDHYLCRSESLAAALRDKGCPAAKISLVRTGVPVPSEVPERSAPPRHLLQACRLIAKKGIDLSIRAFASVARNYPELRLRLAGSGPEEPALRRLAAEIGIADRVDFLGFLGPGALEEEYCRAALFLHPSRTTEGGDREGIPNALLEAMAWGLPCIATRHSGIPEAVESGREGVLVPENDPAALEQALGSLCGDAGLRHHLGAAARARVQREFSCEASAASLEAVYRSVAHPSA